MKINHATLLVILALILTAHSHEGHDHHHGHGHDHDGHDHPSHDSEDSAQGTNTEAPKYEIISNVLHLTDSNLQEAKVEFPLLFVKFYAPWCGHCKRMTQFYIELATETAAEEGNPYTFAQVDCTIHKLACNKHAIKGYPTLKFFIDGQEHPYNSVRSKQGIREWVALKTKQVREPPQAIGEPNEQL